MTKKTNNTEVKTLDKKLNISGVMNSTAKPKLVCEECGSNRAEKRVFQTGYDGGMRGVFCDGCWVEFCYDFMD